MRTWKRIAIALCAYVALVAAFEAFVVWSGRAHAERGVEADDWAIALTTIDPRAGRRDAIVAGVEVDGRLYVAANHWPRAWYARAVAHPDVEVTRGDAPPRPYRAVPIHDAERDRVAAASALPGVVRVLTGFPPRRFLRLDPR